MKLKLGVFPNLDKENVVQALNGIIEFCKNSNILPVLPECIAQKYNCASYSIAESGSMDFDVAMSLGGDGTLLRMARYIAPLGIPVFGVNFGKLGFLTEVELPSFKEAVLRVRDKQYSCESRSMLQATVWLEDKEIVKTQALNDLVLAKGHFTRLARLSVKIAGQKSANYPSDGLIVATATGSTAYSLSAGGPIVCPELDVSILTPICAHALHTRPLVIPMSEPIEIKVVPPYDDVLLSADGTIIKSISGNETIKIEKSPFNLKFIRLNPLSYYETWQQKLHRSDESDKF